MDHFAGLDVSVKETSVCIVDDTGRIFREAKVASEPEALLAALTNSGYHFKRIGLEALPLSQWLFSALAEAGLPVICVETRHMRAVLQAQINKTDRNDARGIENDLRGTLRNFGLKVGIVGKLKFEARIKESRATPRGAWGSNVRFGSKADISHLSNVMSALVPKMSALTPIADIHPLIENVRFGPIADMGRRIQVSIWLSVGFKCESRPARIKTP
jgi:transposase